MVRPTIGSLQELFITYSTALSPAPYDVLFGLQYMRYKRQTKVRLVVQSADCSKFRKINY